MNITACALAALVAFEAAASTAKECTLTDNRCKAKQYEHRAAAATMPGPRALYLYNAHRSYAILFEEAGQVSDLCDARRTLDASLAVEGQPKDQRLISQRKQEDLTSLARQHGARCKQSRGKSPHPSPPRSAVAELLKAPATTPPATLAKQAVPAPVAPSETPPTTLATQSTPTPRPTTPAPATPDPQPQRVAETTDPSAVEGPVSSPPMRLARPRSRLRVGVGASLVVVGAGLLVGVPVAIVGRNRYNEQIDALNVLGARERRPLTEAEMAESVAWNARFVRLEKTAAVLAGLAAVSVLAGVLVLVLPRRSQKTLARVSPLGAGVHIRF